MDVQTLKKKNLSSEISSYIDEFLPFRKDHQTKLESVLKEMPRSADVFRDYWIKEANKGKDQVAIWIYDTDSNLNIWRPATVRTCMFYRGVEADGYPATVIGVQNYKGHYYYELDSLISRKWKIMELRE